MSAKKKKNKTETIKDQPEKGCVFKGCAEQQTLVFTGKFIPLHRSHATKARLFQRGHAWWANTEARTCFFFSKDRSKPRNLPALSNKYQVKLTHENCYLVTAEWGSIRSRMQLLHVHVELQQFQLGRTELEDSSINFFWVWNEEVLIHEWNLMHVCRNVALCELHLFALDGWKGWMWYYKDMRPKCFCWTAASPKPKRNFKRTNCKNVKTRPTGGRADPSIHTALFLIEYLFLHGRMSYFQQNRLGFTL